MEPHQGPPELAEGHRPLTSPDSTHERPGSLPRESRASSSSLLEPPLGFGVTSPNSWHLVLDADFAIAHRVKYDQRGALDVLDTLDQWSHVRRRHVPALETPTHMPELPEVEATRLNLERWTHNSTISAVATDPPTDQLDPLVGQRLGPWQRQGKRLASVLGTPPSSGTLLVQLGMTGRIVKDAPPERPYQRVVLTLSHKRRTTRISLIDLRRLGRVAIVPSIADAFAGLGPDALTTPLDAAALRTALRTTRAPIKSALMDQAIISGLGNIAVLEACFRAKLHPLRPASSLTDAELTRLAPAITAHLDHTLATTAGHDEVAYVSEGGDNPFLVYGREDEPCPSCAADQRVHPSHPSHPHRILRVLQGGRPVFWCPACQPTPPSEKHLDHQASRSSRQS